MTVRVSCFEPMYDVVPQAIFWRPLHYFTTEQRSDEDGLDQYVGASFTIGNRIRFDLRNYRGHPKCTVTMYLPFDVQVAEEISEQIRRVVHSLVIPRSSIAWQRGMIFEFGELDRPKGDRLLESETRILVLKIAARASDRTATTEQIKRDVPEYVELSAIDRIPSKTRRREQRWQQIVGNVISHRDTPEGPFAKGYAVRTTEGLRVTDAGITYLNSIGFSV